MADFLITWKDSGWPYENLRQIIRAYRTTGHVDQPWRFKAHRQVDMGDRVFALKQGRGPKGIFGVGEVTGEPSLGDTGSGKVQMMVPIRFTQLVDPIEELLVPEGVAQRIISSNLIRAQASGYPIPSDQALQLETYMKSHLPTSLAGQGDWTPSELQAIVHSYFDMLSKELNGKPFSKKIFRERLQKTVSRTKGSIERKHQNISAVLQEIGLPWIEGYKPLRNYQGALLLAVESHLDSTGELVALTVPKRAPTLDLKDIFVEPPLRKEKAANPVALRRFVGKYDPARRESANKKLGTAGEKYVLGLERRRLKDAGQPELARRVRWVAHEVGDGLGYDISSFEIDGTEIFIEVKTTLGGISTPFYLTERERRVAAELRAAYRLYRLFDFNRKPRIYPLYGPLEDKAHLEPITYRVFF